jgi:nucleotide-binding universal stress UspA family protein
MNPALVVLTDLSAAANGALAYATTLAAWLPARLVLLHIYLSASPWIAPDTVLITTPAELASRWQARLALQKQAHELPVPATAELTLAPPAPALATAVQQHQPLLLVLGRQQPPALLDQLQANHLLPVAQAARHPLLLIPETWRGAALPRRLLVAADGLPCQVAPPARALAGLLRAIPASTVVVHVAPVVHGPSRGAEALASVCSTSLFGYLASGCLYEVRAHDPAEGILQAARELGAELVIVLARPRSLLGGLLHYSTTAQVLRRSPVPVLVLPSA